MWRVDSQQLSGWRSITPFPHVVVDDVLAPGDLDDLMGILDEEPVDRYEGDIFAFDATAPEPTTEAFREIRDRFARELAPLFTQALDRAVSRVDMRAYAYRPGHFLLPHTDHQEELGRVFAYAYYLPSPEPPRGGELELYRCGLADGELVDIASARIIEPRANRLVVFEVGERSLHQVHEVLAGLRLSLAGWFYP